MSYINYHEITTNLPFLKLFDYIEIQQTLNQHAELTLKGIVEEESKDECVKRYGGQTVQISNQREKKTLFCGIIHHIQVRAVNQVYFVEIKGISFSFLMDVKKIKKSYQNTALTYEEMIQQKMASYTNASMIGSLGEGRSLGQLIVQYQETDWEFIKRMASHFNHPIVPIVRQEGIKISFGIPEGKMIGDLDHYNYQVERDVAGYLKASSNYNTGLSEADSLEFTITTNQDFDIGDQCTFLQRPLYIKSKKVFYQEAVLTFSYQLAPSGWLSQNTLFCESISGISISGKVLESIGDKIKVHLAIDESQEVETAWLFPYSTLYTAEGNTGWYCMPEKGDVVNIYFPGNQEAAAMGLNSVRSGSDGDKTNDPSIKYFRTANGKELKFSSDEILITCINVKDQETGEEKKVYIRLNQDSGVEIISTESIYFKSDKNIIMKAEDAVKILAEEEVRLKCKTSEIRLDSMVDICGEEVKIN